MTTSTSNRMLRRFRAAGPLRRDGRAGQHLRRDALTGQFLERSITPRRQRSVGRVAAGKIVWPSGEGREIGTIDVDLDRLLGTVRRRMYRGAVREPVSYGEDGAARALVLGQPRRQTLACLVADATQAPGVVAVIADLGADPEMVVKRVERVLGRGFEVHRHAL
jgi:hypothetical protein